MLRNFRSVRHNLSGAKLQHCFSAGRVSGRCVSGESFSSYSSLLQGTPRCQATGRHVSRSRATLTSPIWPGPLSRSSRLCRNFHVAAVLSGDKSIDVVTPPFAESITQGDIRWEKALNDAVETDEVLAEIETDKTNIPVPSPASGVLVEMYVEDEATVEAGTKLCKISLTDAPPTTTTSTSGETPPPPEPVSETPKTPAPPLPPPPAAPAATPTMAVDTPIPTTIPPIPPLPGQPLSQSSPPPPVVTPAAASRDSMGGSRTEKRVKLSRMRQRIAERLKEAQNVNAMLTTFNEIDMSNIIALRSRYKDEFLKKHGVKLGFMSAFMRASVHALQDQPVVNAVIDGKEVVYRDYIDISVAVATPKGLVVPVLRNVEDMNFADIELGINELGVKAKEGTLAVEDMDGGTFTISNGGVFGSLYGTPIINPPQSAILGMHATKDRPVAVNGKVEVRPMMYVALTYDHRLIDGREAVLFLKKIKSAVEDPQVVLLNV